MKVTPSTRFLNRLHRKHIAVEGVLQEVTGGGDLNFLNEKIYLCGDLCYMIEKSKILPWLAAVATVAIWAETFISSKVVIGRGVHPADLFFYRFVIAYIFIWIISPKKLLSENWKDELLFVALGVTGGSLYFLAENTALEYSTASNVAILVSSAPLMTALVVGAFHKEERLSPGQLAGSLIAFVGMALVVLNGSLVLHISPVGDSMAIGAALMWAFYSLILRKVSGRYDTVFITRKVFAYGLVTMLFYFLIVRPLNFDRTVLSEPAVWGNIVYLGTVASLLCFLMWNWAIEKIGTVKTTNLIYGQSFFTMFIASVVLGEKITPMAILGAMILVIGMMLAFKRRA